MNGQDSRDQGSSMNGHLDSGNGSQSTASQGKGKGKDAQSSWTDRLQASGKMALNSVTGASPSTAPNGGTSGKAATNGHSSQSNWRPDTVAGEASSIRTQGGTSQGQTVRSFGYMEETSQEYRNFTDQQPTIPSLDHAHHPAAGQGEYPQGRAVTDQQAADGAAVLQLLSQVNLIDETEPSFEDYNQELPPDDIARLRNALFTSTHEALWDDLLNFTPDFLARRRPDEATQQQQHGGQSEASWQYTGIPDQFEGRQIWLAQWGEVLSAYTEQVWGDLGPLAAQAKKEVDELAARGDDGAGAEPKGLRRLRQILGHVRGGR